MEDEILKKKTVINDILYTPTVVPDVLKDCLLILAHDKKGHNGFKRTKSSLKQLYHWKGMKKTIQRHCNTCSTCAKHNIKVQHIQKEHFKVPPQPMEFIAMDLIGDFHPPSSKGNRYALMAVCMLTGFTFCIPIKSKKVKDVMKAYTDNICCVFRPSKKGKVRHLLLIARPELDTYPPPQGMVVSAFKYNLYVSQTFKN